MRAVCVMCHGHGVTAELRQTVGGHSATVSERCRTCGGSGFYDWTKGPGVDPYKRHGTGRVSGS